MISARAHKKVLCQLQQPIRLFVYSRLCTPLCICGGGGGGTCMCVCVWVTGCTAIDLTGCGGGGV